MTGIPKRLYNNHYRFKFLSLICSNFSLLKQESLVLDTLSLIIRAPAR